MKSGVRQECELSPLFFNIYSEKNFQTVLENIEEEIKVNAVFKHQQLKVRRRIKKFLTNSILSLDILQRFVNIPFCYMEESKASLPPRDAFWIALVVN